MQVNASAFTVTYDGFQANNFVLLNGAVVSNLTNAGSVKSEGFEVDLLAVPVDGLTLRASGAYADATVKRFNPNPPPTRPMPATAPSCRSRRSSPGPSAAATSVIWAR